MTWIFLALTAIAILAMVTFDIRIVYKCGGYQPKTGLNTRNPPKGGSGVAR